MNKNQIPYAIAKTAFVANFLEKSTLFKNSIYNHSDDFLVPYYNKTNKNYFFGSYTPKRKMIEECSTYMPSTHQDAWKEMLNHCQLQQF